MTKIFQSIKALFQRNASIVATNETIQKIVQNQIKRLGNQADLNHIDVSQVTDMRGLFEDSPFNGDISKWDVSNVKNMSHMFFYSQFNGDISQWDVSNVKNMQGMFAQSMFNGDLSQWNVSNVCDMGFMFAGSPFNGDISQWNVSNTFYLTLMFRDSSFNGDVSKWQLNPECHFEMALADCPAALSEHFGQLHFLCKASNEDFILHPTAQAIWDEHAAMPSSIGAKGPELGRAVWTSYQASLNQAQPVEDLESFDFTV